MAQLKAHIKVHIMAQLKTHIKVHIMAQLKAHIKEHIKEQLKAHIKVHIKARLKVHIKAQLKTYIKTHIKESSRGEFINGFSKKVGSFLFMKRKSYSLILLLVLLGTLLALSGCNKGGSSDQLLEVELDVLEEGGEGENAKEQLKEASEFEEQVDNTPVFVHVCGAVNNPGVVELTGNKRVFEAIDLAGGLRDDAAVSYINLARMVEDGERVYVPNLEEIAQLNDGRLDIHLFLEMVGNGENNSSVESSGKVNINQAGLDELMTLSGIGPSKARSIMDYREQHGGFNTIEELMNVSGIGTSTFDKIKEFVTL